MASVRVRVGIGVVFWLATGCASGKPPAAAVEHAPLKVVKLEPAEGGIATLSARTPDVAPAERPDAPGERPVIRLRGRGDSKADSKGGEGPPRESVRVVEEGEGK
jgi:hypothetical protein